MLLSVSMIELENLPRSYFIVVSFALLRQSLKSMGNYQTLNHQPRCFLLIEESQTIITYPGREGTPGKELVDDAGGENGDAALDR